MEDKNNHIDDFAKRGVEGMNFEFKDSYWDEMEALLDNKSKSKRGIIFWWVTGIASVLVVALGVYLWNGNQQSQDQLVLSNENQQEKVDEKHNEGAVDDMFNQTTEQPKVESQANENLASRNLIESNSDKNHGASFDMNNQPDKLANQNVVASVNSAAKNNSTSSVGKTSDKMAELNDLNETDVVEQELLSEYIQPIEKRNTSEIETEETHLSPINVIGNSNSKSIHTNVEMIGGLGYGMNTTNNFNSIGGMNGSFGLQFNIEYGRFALQTGLTFGVNGIKGLQFKESKRIYGFSSQEAVNEINYNSMLSASVPVYLGYSGLKHSFSAGVKLNFLLNANGRVDTWNGEGNSTNTWGYSNALNNSWIAAGANYFYKLNRRFSVGLMVDFDLTNRGEYKVNDEYSDFKMWNAFVGVKYRLN